MARSVSPEICLSSVVLLVPRETSFQNSIVGTRVKDSPVESKKSSSSSSSPSSLSSALPNTVTVSKVEILLAEFYFLTKQSLDMSNFFHGDDERAVTVYVYGDETSRDESSMPGAQDVLTVSSVDFKIPDNGKAHHTDRFAISQQNNDNPKLVVRRGHAFSIEVTFSRPYDETTDELMLVFQAGNEPKTSNGTYQEFTLSDTDVPEGWGAKIVSRENDTINMDIFTSATCIVATWSVSIDVIKKSDTEVSIYRYTAKNPIYILFNPWCKYDLVYMEDENLLNEYILNETGEIYVGTETSIASRPWNIGQFESPVLDVALYLLDHAGVKWSSRGSPVHIGRRVSAVVNAQDDRGVVAGNWSGEYSDGTSPLAWISSVPILEEFGSTKSPVRYGQCWVFAAVATTVFRALGIPARAVTNFSSAHDTDGSITVDYEVDINGEEINKKDSVWNFHVWTEMWTARPDLPLGYGGWQVTDATPQEKSIGIYCCGPTSVLAVQQGDVNLPYDGPFVFAEVNADTLYWLANERGVLECVHIDQTAIGKLICTKAPNSTDREDLTLKYKYAEGTVEERAAVKNANLIGSSRTNISAAKANDVNFSVKQDSENTWVGKDFVVGLKMKNKSANSRYVSGRIVVSAMFYNGTMANTLKSEPFSVELKASEEKVQNVVVTQDEYNGHLKEDCILGISAAAFVKETKQTYVNRKNFRLRKPHLTAKAPAEIAKNEEFKVDVSFANPVNVTLTDCTITVDGVVIRKIFECPYVSPEETFSTSLVVAPKKTGNGQIIIIFNSKELADINTTLPLFIREI